MKGHWAEAYKNSAYFLVFFPCSVCILSLCRILNILTKYIYFHLSQNIYSLLFFHIILKIVKTLQCMLKSGVFDCVLIHLHVQRNMQSTLDQDYRNISIHNKFFHINLHVVYAICCKLSKLCNCQLLQSHGGDKRKDTLFSWFHVYIMLILLLQGLSTLFVMDHLWSAFNYILLSY